MNGQMFHIEHAYKTIRNYDILYLYNSSILIKKQPHIAKV